MDHAIEQIRDHVTRVFQKPGAHGLDHIMRVTSLCSIIGTKEEADMSILIPAALFHDIARPVEEETGIPHEEEGARMAEAFLISIRYQGDLIPLITHAIRSHRFRSSNKPETLEAKILSDADKLDAIGAVGIARACITAGERDGDIRDAIDHINEKLLKLSGMMYTTSAKDIAHERHGMLTHFLKVLESELEIPDMPKERR